MYAFLLACLASVALAEEPSESSSSVVHIETTKPGFTLGVIDSRGTAVASNGTTATAVYTRDVCVAPCSFETNPGLVEIFAHQDGKIATAYRIQVNPGETTLSVEPGSAAAFTGGTYLMYLGLGLAGTGGALLATGGESGLGLPGGSSAAMLGGGLAALGGGFALRITNKGKWSVTAAPQSGSTPARL